LNYLVSGRQQRFRNGKAERLGRLEIDDELELGRLHDRQVGGLTFTTVFFMAFLHAHFVVADALLLHSVVTDILTSAGQRGYFIAAT
jgi:hypothetical protein